MSLAIFLYISILISIIWGFVNRKLPDCYKTPSLYILIPGVNAIVLALLIVTLVAVGIVKLCSIIKIPISNFIKDFFGKIDKFIQG